MSSKKRYTYPKTKDYGHRRIFDYSWSRVPGSQTVGGVTTCLPANTGEKTRTINVVGKVVLGRSPWGWKYLIPRGINATSTLSGTVQSIRAGSGHYSYYAVPGLNPSLGYCYKGSGYGSMGPASTGSFIGVSTSVSASADQIAKTKLLKKYLDARSTFRGGNFIAEVIDTYRMIRHPVDSLWKQTNEFVGRVGKLRNVYKRSHREYGKRLSDAWLAYQYGIKPLFGDIKDANNALEALGSSTAFDGKLIRAAGYVDGGSFGPVTGLSLSPLTSFISYQQSDTTREEVRYQFLLKARPVSFETVQETLGIQTEDILPALWEAIPWSFLVDYFVNVNDVLDSWKLARAVVGWGIRGAKNTSSRSHLSWINSNLPDGVHVRWGVTPWIFRSVYLNRIAMSTIPYPSFDFKLPSVGQNFNIGALWNSIRQTRPR